MKTGAIRRHMLQATLSTAFRDDGPKRAIRNLVELGEKFSVGCRQRAFFTDVREMLRKDSSVYYLLWERMVRDTDHDCLQTFGINVGYNGCTAGVRTLRALERAYHCGIPSILGAVYNGGEMDGRQIDSLVRQGEKLGIYTYVIDYCDGDVDVLAGVLAAHKDSGFIVLTGPCKLTPQNITMLTVRKNVMLAVSADSPEFPRICQTLRETHTLYCVYAVYNETRAADILSGDLVEHIGEYSGTFVFLLPEDCVSEKTAERVGAYAAASRREQRWPFILMDLREDLIEINKAIARSGCFVCFDTDGQLVTEKGRTDEPLLNIRKLALLDIFKSILVLEG